MRKLVDETLIAWKSVGNVTYSISITKKLKNLEDLIFYKRFKKK